MAWRIVTCCGALALGKSDFEAVENVRDDEFFADALGVSAVTSRRRLDARVADFFGVVEQASVDFLYSAATRPTALDTGHVPLDADVTPFDNSGNRKEGAPDLYHRLAQG